MSEKKKEVASESDDIVERFRQRVREQFNEPIDIRRNPSSSREYQAFKSEYMPKHLTIYEKLCNISEKIFRIAPDKKKEPEMKEAIAVCHLDITPTGAMSFSVLVPLVIAVFGSLLGYAIFNSTFMVAFFLIAGLAIMIPLGNLPLYFANNWRLKASNEMVTAVFYIVTHMRHTSNLENAIDFACDHLSGPLSLDLKKILWDVETEKYDSVKESLDMYLESWRRWNMEFIEAMHLIESSLYESSEDRRLTLLDKSLDVILTETYEKMLHYAQNLKSPITMLHMLGIILPILGLVILPLVVSFMEGVMWYHLAMLYNVALPIAVYVMGRNILSRRPTGYGDVDVAEYNPELKKYRNVVLKLGTAEIQIPPIYLSIILFVLLFLVGVLPIILHQIGMPDFNVLGEGFDFLGYRPSKANPDELIGPYGFGASIFSFFITLAFALSIGLYFKLRSRNVMKIREKTKSLETEFSSALFQLGNRLGDGIPPELAFAKVGDVMSGTISGEFFTLVDMKIRKLGVSVKQAIFDPVQGALKQFPSNLIESSMKVLVESAKKGPRIAAQALMSISRYVREIHRVNERLKDLLADIISSMKSQTSFLTPVIAGIVIGITSMITTILGQLGNQIKNVAGQGVEGNSLGGLASMFGDGIPTYYFQIIVGIYVVQITYVLTILSNGIENGSDKLNENYLLGVNMIRSPIMFVIVSSIVMVVFNFIAIRILGATLQGMA
ncbi:hypothetical protein JXA85_03840 [Candidatus Woesearchaeota archaeon]|nr:hypothetical protein [Candidatus Woesearchaeota archaeon]